MARLVPTPQDLIDHLLRLLPHPAPAHRPSGPTTVDRILDAALDAFTEQGIPATTMTRVARDAGISREWLYKQFANRDALVLAVSQREVARFIDGLAVRSFASEDFVSALTDTFVYAVEFLRDHALLQRSLRSDALSLQLLQGAGPVLGLAVRAGASYISAFGDLGADESTMVAETLVRLAASTTIASTGVLDLHDGDQLRNYAAVVVPAVIAGARASKEHATR